MLALLDILKYSFGSVIWGIMIAVICMVLFVLIIKGWYKDATFSPVSYVVGFFLFLLLSIQCVLITGSLKIIEISEEYESRISTIVESISFPADEVSQTEASRVIDTVIDELPILQYYISGGEFSGFTAKELPHAIVTELRLFMRWYIFRRILWCLGFVIVGAVFVIKSMSNIHVKQRTPRLQRIQQDRKRISRRPRR